MKNICQFVKNYPKSVYIFSLVFAHTRIIASVQVKILYGIDSVRTLDRKLVGQLVIETYDHLVSLILRKLCRTVEGFCAFFSEEPAPAFVSSVSSHAARARTSVATVRAENKFFMSVVGC